MGKLIKLELEAQQRRKESWQLHSTMTPQRSGVSHFLRLPISFNNKLPF
jgi:hypothetical protein